MGSTTKLYSLITLLKRDQLLRFAEDIVMALEDQSDAATQGKAAKMSAKKSSAGKSVSGNPSYRDMVIEAITVQKEKSGSSLDGIKKFLGSNYNVDISNKAGLLNSTLKKMRDEGVLVPGAQPGRKGSGCFKLSAEEKARIADEAKSAAKKLKGVGKVSNKASKEVAKKVGGSAKKIPTKKTAVSVKKPAPKAKKLAPKAKTAAKK